MAAHHRFDNDKRRRADDHDRQSMMTPAYVLDPIRSILGVIGLDPCTEPDNPTRAETFYALPTDGLSQAWDAKTIFVNPPYGAARERWVKRCLMEAQANSRQIVLLIPAATETKIVQMGLKASTTALFVKARLTFEARRENGRRWAASHGSIIFGFNVDLSPMSEIGVVMSPVRTDLF